MRVRPSFTMKEAIALLNSTVMFDVSLEGDSLAASGWTGYEYAAYRRACTKLAALIRKGKQIERP